MLGKEIRADDSGNISRATAGCSDEKKSWWSDSVPEFRMKVICITVRENRPVVWEEAV